VRAGYRIPLGGHGRREAAMSLLHHEGAEGRHGAADAHGVTVYIPTIAAPCTSHQKK
jgi:hypothetical protein